MATSFLDISSAYFCFQIARRPELYAAKSRNYCKTSGRKPGGVACLGSVEEGQRSSQLLDTVRNLLLGKTLM